MLSQPVSRGFAEPPPPVFPLTSISKSVSLVPLASSEEPAMAPNDIKSSLTAEVVPLPSTDRSCSFLVCSSSTLLDSDLMSPIKFWNCFRFKWGPKLMAQRMGSISIATKSESATLPMTFRVFSAAIITAGSFVLIALTRGTIFSCIVYLSRTLDVDVFFSGPKPSRPSSPESSLEPPQRETKACRPLTLMARLLVLLKMVAMTGNSSLLIELKSKTGNIVGKLRNAASTRLGVLDSNATNTTGRISIQCQSHSGRSLD